MYMSHACHDCCLSSVYCRPCGQAVGNSQQLASVTVVVRWAANMQVLLGYHSPPVMMPILQHVYVKC